jgi:hypothetical protein
MGGKSSSAQKAEGDIVFNNVDYGGETGQSGAGGLKNFNVGRENTLADNVFNFTDYGATNNAIKANEAVTKTALNNGAVITKFALDANSDVADKAFDLVVKSGEQVTASQVTSAQATGKALDYVFEASKTSTERQSENLIKYATYGAVAIISAVALTAMVKK